MAPEPFLVTPLRSCRDLLHARHRARQVAQLLKFAEIDVVCIAAGAFLIAQQGRQAFRRAELCFALVERRLRVFARSRSSQKARSESLYVLSKPLPQHDEPLAGEDIGWLLGQVERLAPTTPQDEILRQNQEVLTLLLALRGSQATCDLGLNPSAA